MDLWLCKGINGSVNLALWGYTASTGTEANFVTQADNTKWILGFRWFSFLSLWLPFPTLC